MNIAIQTAQNVSIDYELADVGSRMLASFIDFIMIALYIWLMWTLTVQLGLSSLLANTSYQIVFFAVPMLIYHPLSEILLKGQSLGKKALKLKVVRLDGYEPTIDSFLIRGLLGMFEVITTTGVLATVVVILNKKSQRIGDLAAGTVVIRIRQRAKLEDTILQVLADDYKPTFSNVASLTDRDVSLIKELLDNAVKQRNLKLLEQLSLKVRTILDVESTLPPKVFLQTVIKDYNFYTKEMV